MDAYAAHVVSVAGIYLVLVYALNLLAGEAGLMVFCLGGMWGIGAYTAALLLVGGSGMPFVPDLAFAGDVGLEVAFPAAMAAGGAAGLIAALAVLRFRSDVFVLATMAVQTIFVSLLENAAVVTRGPAGLYGVPAPRLGGVAITGDAALAGMVGTVAFVVAAGLINIRQSSFGLHLRALRDNEKAAAALGVPPARRLAAAFVLAGLAAGAAGTLYVCVIGYVDPMSFGLHESILLVAMLLIGGRGTVLGPLAGVCTLVLIPELLRHLGLPDDNAAAWRNVILGASLVGLAFARPQGLLGEDPA